MGQGCFKPKIFKKPGNGLPPRYYPVEEKNIFDDFKKAMIQVNDEIYESMIKDPSNEEYSAKTNGKIVTSINIEEVKIKDQSNEELIARTNNKRVISKNFDEIYDKTAKDESNKEKIARTNNKRSMKSVDDSTQPKLPKYETKLLKINFFTDFYTIDDLEEFLSSCSTSSISDSPKIIEDSEDEDLSKSLSELVFLGSDKEVENLTESEVEKLLKQKIHLKLSEKPEYVKKLTILLKKASRNKSIGDVIDLKNDEENSAISIAALNLNIQAFYYLLMKCEANIPLNIYKEGKRIPFLIYLAKYGKIKNSKENNKVTYLLQAVLNKLIENYPKEYLLNHLTEVDEETNLTLPHFLLNIYGQSADLKQEIIECFKLCIIEGPECANAMCINYYDPRFKYNVTANLISHPDINSETIAEFMEHLKKGLEDNDKKLLQQLVRVHQDKKRTERLLQSIS